MSGANGNGHTNGHIVLRDPAKLREHDENYGIYGDDADDDLIASVREKGVLEPLLILRDDTLVSGHRRRDAAVKAGRPEVPCRVNKDVDPGDRLAVLELLLDANQYRTKTNEQKLREAAVWKEIEAAKAAKRKEATLAKPGEKAATRQGGGNVSTSLKQRENAKNGPGKARDKAAEKVGWSGRTLDKAEKVREAIQTCEKAGKDDRAKELRDTLNRSVDAAYKLVTEPAKPKAATEDDPKAKAIAYLKAAEKSLGALQDNYANALRCGAKGPALSGYAKGVYDALLTARKSL